MLTADLGSTHASISGFLAWYWPLVEAMVHRLPVSFWVVTAALDGTVTAWALRHVVRRRRARSGGQPAVPLYERWAHLWALLSHDLHLDLKGWPHR